MTSTHETPDRTAIEAFTVNSMKLYQFSVSVDDKLRGFIIQLVVWGLLYLESTKPGESQERFESKLQAALFLRHILVDTPVKDDRVLHLVATRVHLGCGLGTIAFEHYRNCKVKEMLHDNLDRKSVV